MGFKNWIDEHPGDLPFEDTEEVNEPDSFEDFMRNELTKKIFSKPKDVDEQLQTNKKTINSLAEDMSDVALTFHRKLKGKFTLKQITEMVINVYNVIGAK